MKNRSIGLFKNQIFESVRLNEGVDQEVKRSCIERLSQFFRVPANNLSKFKFDGTDNIKELTKALNSTSDAGTKAYYEVAIKVGKQDAGIYESEEVNEKAMDTKYWADYNDDTSIQGSPKSFSDKSKDFEDTFEEAVSEWNREAEGAENRIKGAQIQNIRKLAQEFFKIEKWISVNVIQAMIMQES
jgi:hypothetical protein